MWEKGWLLVQPVQRARAQRRAASTRFSVQHPQAAAIRRGRRRKQGPAARERALHAALLCKHEDAQGHRLRRDTVRYRETGLRRERGAK